MVLPPAMLHEVVRALKPLRALDAVVLAQAREVFGWFGGSVAGEVRGGAEVCVDLVEMSGGGVSGFVFRGGGRWGGRERRNLVMRLVLMRRMEPMAGGW